MRTHPKRTATCQSRGYASSSRERPPRRTHCSLASPERIPPSWFRVLPRGEPPEASRSARLVADFQHAPRLTLLVARHVARQRSGAQYAHGQRSCRPSRRRFDPRATSRHWLSLPSTSRVISRQRPAETSKRRRGPRTPPSFRQHGLDRQGVVARTALAFPPLGPAVADATTASATPETVACRALTTNVPSDRTCCSLSTNWPPGMETVWFTVPSTGTATPLIERLEMYEVPSPELPFRGARAAASAELAAMVIPAMLRQSEQRQELEAIWSA